MAGARRQARSTIYNLHTWRRVLSVSTGCMAACEKVRAAVPAITYRACDVTGAWELSTCGFWVVDAKRSEPQSIGDKMATAQEGLSRSYYCVCYKTGGNRLASSVKNSSLTRSPLLERLGGIPRNLARDRRGRRPRPAESTVKHQQKAAGTGRRGAQQREWSRRAGQGKQRHGRRHAALPPENGLEAAQRADKRPDIS